MKEEFREYEDLIQKMQGLPKAAPPDDFTPRVMGNVMKLKEGVCRRTWQYLSRPREFSLDPIRALRTGVSREEISLYFMLVAFAHLVLAVVLTAGLKHSEAGAFIPELLWWQPGVSLLLAFWLAFWGIRVKKSATTGIQGAKFASLLYMEAVVINGVLLMMAFKPVLLLGPIFAIVAGIGVATGIFLAISCSPGNKRINQGPTTVV